MIFKILFFIFIFLRLENIFFKILLKKRHFYPNHPQAFAYLRKIKHQVGKKKNLMSHPTATTLPYKPL